jgi:hypothetical protein
VISNPRRADTGTHSGSTARFADAGLHSNERIGRQPRSRQTGPTQSRESERPSWTPGRYRCCLVALPATIAVPPPPAELGTRGRVRRLLARPQGRTLPPPSAAASRSRGRRQPRCNGCGSDELRQRGLRGGPAQSLSHVKEEPPGSRARPSSARSCTCIFDAGVCSIAYDELIAVLLLRHQRGHAVQPAPGLWNGRDPELSAGLSPSDRETGGGRPDQQRRRVSPAWLVAQAERKPPSAGRAAGRRLLVSTNSGHVFVADPVAAVVRFRQRETLVRRGNRGRFGRP